MQRPVNLRLDAKALVLKYWNVGADPSTGKLIPLAQVSEVSAAREFGIKIQTVGGDLATKDSRDFIFDANDNVRCPPPRHAVPSSTFSLSTLIALAPDWLLVE